MILYLLRILAIEYKFNQLENMLIFIVLSLLNLVTVLSQDSCNPLWPRIQFGNIYADSNNPQKLIIKFNTRSSCEKSYVTLVDSKGSLRKIYCQSQTLILSQNMAKYQIFQQRCSISQIQFEQKIQYIPYGSNSTEKSIPFNNEPLSTLMVHPNASRTVKLISLADWGQLHQKIENYTSLNSTFDKLRGEDNIDGLIINGDIAYDLDTNNGINYEEFLNILSRIARYVPVFLNTGNHEHLSKDDLHIFYFTFQQYGKQSRLAVGLNLGPVYIIGFDPYEILYVKKQVYRRLRMETQKVKASQSYIGLQEMIKIGKSLNKILVTSSHYPFTCSAPDKKCTVVKQLLKDFFQLMLENGVKLYLGAHVHTYQRIYPYCMNQTYIIHPSPYIMTQSDNCFVSVIDGVAGNDIQLLDKYDQIQPFTASYMYGKTGFGFLAASQNNLNYSHYSSENILTLKDQFSINFKRTNIVHQLLLDQ